MGITGELRGYVQSWRETPNLMDELDAGDIDGIFGDIEHIADRIDIAHKHAIGYVDDRDPETMAENGWVKLPVDANGEYIHVGDVLDGYGKECQVWRLALDSYGIWSFSDSLVNTYYDMAAFSHHHEPTVEDVLRELEGMRGNGADYETVVMRCAELAKTLRGLLADDGEEQ